MAISTRSVFGFLNVFAFMSINKGFATIQANVGTMILMIEPIIGSLLGFFFFQEIPSITFLIGASLLLTAVCVAYSSN